MVNCA